jgi:GDP-L-fucose synthase
MGSDISIADLAGLIKEIVGYDGELLFDTSKPDGTPRKLMDVSKLSQLGWQARIDLTSGIRAVYEGILRERPW